MCRILVLKNEKSPALEQRQQQKLRRSSVLLKMTNFLKNIDRVCDCSYDVKISQGVRFLSFHGQVVQSSVELRHDYSLL